MTAEQVAAPATGQPGLSKYPRVFQPIDLGPVHVRNRMYMAPHGISLEAPMPGQGAYNVPSAEAAFYLGERAAGGVGLVFHSTILSPAGRQSNMKATPWFDEAIPSYARVAKEVHSHEAKIMSEVWYAPFMDKSWEPLGPEAPILGASALQQWYMPSVTREMDQGDIDRMVADHARSARNLRDAGYDGVEVHASHSSVIEYFISPSFNRRTDHYGGSLENRMRIVDDTLRAVRENISPTMAVGIRLNADELLPNGYDAGDCREILAHLVDRGLVDFIDLDVSVEPEQQNLMSTSHFNPKLHNAPRVADVRAAAGAVPVLAAPGRLTRVAEAEKILADGIADMVGAVRGLIAEPMLVKHALEGREQESRTCVAANHCLEAAVLQGFGCAINAEAGKEPKWRRGTDGAAKRAMNVVVVGGGPCGLEAARVAALRGHQVTLFESRGTLGGGLTLWSQLPGREQMGTLVPWFQQRLDHLGVVVRTGVIADSELILKAAPDVVLLATGARYSPSGDNGYRRADIPGWDQDFVLTPEEVLEGGAPLTGRVLILDEEGLNAAAGLAELAAARGADVTIVTRKAGPGAHLRLTQGEVVGRLVKAGVKILAGMWLASIGDHIATVQPAMGGSGFDLPVDTVVLATMRVPQAGPAGLDGRVPHVYTIGDALSPRGLREATYEGYRFARLIGDDDMPATISELLYQPVAAVVPAASLDE